jgi:hypothetical protein
MRPVERSVYGYFGSTDLGVNYQVGNPVVIDADIVDSSPYRPTGEYLYDGGMIDSYNNRVCRNVQFNGTITPKISIGDSSLPIPSSRYTISWITTPPIVRQSGRLYWILNVEDLRFVVRDSRNPLNTLYYWFFTIKANGHWHQGWVCTWLHARSSGTHYYYSGCGINANCSGDRTFSRGKFRLVAQQLANLVSDKFKDSKGQWREIENFSYDALVAQNESIIRQYGPTIRNTMYSDLVTLGSTGSSWNRVTFPSLNPSSSTIDLDELDNRLFLMRELAESYRFDEHELSIHAREVIESVNDFDSNLQAYFSDIGKFGDSIRSVLSLIGDIKNPKAWASAWLSQRFSDRLSISDTKELMEALREALLHRQYYTRGRARMDKAYSIDSIGGYASTIRGTLQRASTVYIDPAGSDGLSKTIENLMRWDAWPTLENTWDQIPLSFVVDWLIPVSDLLSQVDAFVEAPYFNVKSSYIGESNRALTTITGSSFAGQVEYKRYYRTPYNPLGDVRPFDWDLDFLPSFNVVHLGDVLALAVQFW